MECPSYKARVLYTCAGYINSVVPDGTTAARRFTANILRNWDVLCANTRLYLVETFTNMAFKITKQLPQNKQFVIQDPEGSVDST